MRVVVHEPTVEAPDETGRTVSVVLAAVRAELGALSDGPPGASSDAPSDAAPETGAEPRREPTS